MTARCAPRLLFQLWIAILLATIGLQAASPVDAPLDRSRGSAFSASTADVTLISQLRTGSPAAQEPNTPPAAITLPRVPMTRPAAVAALADRPRLRPETRGPPPREWPERVPASHGPPAA